MQAPPKRSREVELVEQKNVRMVLRSIYLPEDVDDLLRSAAFRLRKSKSELVRHYLSAGLAADLGLRPVHAVTSIRDVAEAIGGVLGGKAIAGIGPDEMLKPVTVKISGLDSDGEESWDLPMTR